MTDLYKTQPPDFGSREILKYFMFEPGYINLNNGAWGVLPLPVYEACDVLTRKIESKPDLFLRLEYQDQLKNARADVAQLIGAHPDECVLVPNTSTGINTVVRNFEWSSDDILLICSTSYVSVANLAANIASMSPNPTVSTFLFKYPTTKETVVASFRAHLRSLAPGKNRKIVAMMDSISSAPAVHLPWQELVLVCKEMENVWSLLDAAHSIGQEVGINLSKVQPDFWVSNCHKWLYCKRSCAVLYVPFRNQHIIRSTLPTAAYKPGFQDQFSWFATIDWVPLLSISFALKFRNWLGGEVVINKYCHDLAVKGGKRMAEVMGTGMFLTSTYKERHLTLFFTEIMEPFGPNGDGILNMVNIRLPFPSTILPTPAIASMFQNKMLREHNISASQFYFQNTWWTRCSAQVWNNAEDFEKAGKAYILVCAEIVKELEEEKA